MAEWVFFTPMSQPTIEILALKKGFLRAAAEPIHALVRIVSPEQPVNATPAPRLTSSS